MGGELNASVDAKVANGAVAQAERTVNFAVRFDRGPSYDPPVPYVWRLGQLVNVAAPTLPDSRPGDTYTFSLETENSLPYPTWLQINPATGALTGTAAGATGQQYYFRVVASLVGNSLYRVSYPYSVVTQ